MNKTRKRIALVGPAPPFRGGIALFALHLGKELARAGHQLKFFNFIDQYPGFLFPGGDQYDELSDCAGIPMERVYTPYLPWTWPAAIRKIQSFEPDLVIFSYWLPFFAPSSGWIAHALKRSKIIFLAHNIESHEKWPFAGLLREYALSKADRILLLSQACLRDLNSFLPLRIAQKGLLAFHPIYPPHDLPQSTPADSKATLLFFGLIKPYKGLDLLLKALALVKKELPEIHLIISGAVYGSFQPYQELIDALELADSIELNLRYVNETELGEFFLRSQLCVLPYKTATQSGVIANSYSYDIPVLATKVGGLSEYIIEGKTGYLVPPDRPQKMAEAILKHFREERFTAMQTEIRSYKEQYSWSKLAALILE